jgi:hypothetical protein
MKYLKLFEELTRVLVTVEEKKQLKEIVKKSIAIIKDLRFSGGIEERYRIEYDLGNLKSIITHVEYESFQHKNDGYKKVDDVAAKLSKSRGVEVIFDRKDNCFKTKSGKALCIFNLVSKINIPQSEENPCFVGNKTKVYINYKTGDIFNDNLLDINIKKISDPKIIKDYIEIWDFSGGNIYLPINRIREIKQTEIDVFSILFHEFTHAKDPNAWLPDKTYATPNQIKSGRKGVYAANIREIQTMCNNLLEIVGYYFERTLRGDTDGGGFNYNLTKDQVMNHFIPNIIEVKDFINGKRDTLSSNVIKELSGTNKNTRFMEMIIKFISEIKKDAPDKMKYIQDWMKEDFKKLFDQYNKKILEINKKKQKGQELPAIIPK